MVKNIINQNISRNFSCCAYLSACRPCWIHFDVQYGKMEIWQQLTLCISYRKIHYLMREFRVKLCGKTNIARIRGSGEENDPIYKLQR